MAKVLILAAQGSEEIETTTPYDLLKRAGATVTLAKVPVDATDAENLNIKFSQGLTMLADAKLEDAAKQSWDMIVVPGGMPGTTNVAKSTVAVDLLKKQKAENKWVAAICAAPALVLGANGLLDGEKATCYPALHDKLPEKSMAKEPVVVSNKIITSQSPGTAYRFSLELIKALIGESKMQAIKGETYSMV